VRGGAILLDLLRFVDIATLPTYQPAKVCLNFCFILNLVILIKESTMTLSFQAIVRAVGLLYEFRS
jgi:hypothetical protein